MRMSKAIALVPLVLLAACAHEIDTGYAVADNIVVQVVDMNPQYAGVPIEGGNGDRSVAAYRRYKDGKVKEPITVGSKGTGGGGGGGSPQ